MPVVNRFDTLTASRRNARIVASYQTRFHRHRPGGVWVKSTVS